MKTLAALFVVATLALSACDGGEVIPDPSGMAGAAGAVGGTAGATGAAGAGVGGAPDMRGGTGGAGGQVQTYTPDPLQTCTDVVSSFFLCSGNVSAPTRDAAGSICSVCSGLTAASPPIEDCAVRHFSQVRGDQDTVCVSLAGCADCR